MEVPEGWEISKRGKKSVSSAIKVPKRLDRVMLGETRLGEFRSGDWDRLPDCISVLENCG